MGKYGKQKGPEEIKVDEHSERRMQQVNRWKWGKSEAGGKADRGQERKRFQAN